MSGKTCSICGKPLDNPLDYTSKNCGGDCLECTAIVKDPDDMKQLLIARAINLLFKYCDGTYLGIGEGTTFTNADGHKPIDLVRELQGL